MSKLTDFKRGQIVEAHMVRTSISKVAEVLSVSRSTVLKNVSIYSVQTLISIGDGVFQDDKAPVHTTRIFQDWLSEHEYDLSHPLGDRSHQTSILLSLCVWVLSITIIVI
ncbi:hypothetical protein FHG87_004278 [Trinorchestia longiramus]|nr:hypothetical protein FHG87_004278 [Trinorchestia longiramus]